MLLFSFPFVRVNSIRYEIVYQFALYDPMKSYQPYLYALKKTGGVGVDFKLPLAFKINESINTYGHVQIIPMHGT